MLHVELQAYTFICGFKAKQWQKEGWCAERTGLYREIDNLLT
jgi:hypothetical protein